MIVNIVFTIIMLALAVWDMKSFNGKEHKDFKSLIMSIGILGTFVGIFIGLLGFDTHNLLESVPTLLDGLKTAFYTSIVGMGLAIAISIYQKGKGKIAEESELKFIATQAYKFDELLHLREISSLTNIMRDILSEISRKSNFETDLKGMLKDIDNSLHKALETLASGASKELIKALEIVISDFNTNLKEQFGENFKQLNEATKNMLTWQDNYKEQIESHTHSLREMQKSLHHAQECMNEATQAILANKISLEEIQHYHELNHTIQERLIQALHALGNLEASFEEKLKTISMLKDSSIEALQTSKDFILSIQESKNNLEEYFEHHKEKFLTFFNQNMEQLNHVAYVLKTQHAEALSFMQDSHKEFKSTLVEANTEVLKSFKHASQTSNDLAHTINNDLKEKSNALLLLNESFKTNADTILEKLGESSNKSLEYAHNMHESMCNLYDDKFNILNRNISTTTDVLRGTLKEHANALQDFTKDSLNSIQNTFEERDKRLQDSLQITHTTILENMNDLYQSFQDKVLENYIALQEKILESSQNTQKSIHDNTQRFIEANKSYINENITMLENLHKVALEKIETTNKQTMQETIQNLHTLQSSYKEQLESNIQTLNANLLEQVEILHKNTNETFGLLEEKLQTQHNKMTDSVNEVMKTSSQYFIQTSDDFNELLKGQYKKMNSTFDRHTQELGEFLSTQTQNLTQNLETQNANLKDIFSTQTEQLGKDLVAKGNALHEFLQTQTTCLDTNLQQMLSKFNKMLEHNYINFSDMLEKENNLMVKSLDSQAMNISNNLLQTHKKFDEFLHITHEKLANNADSTLEKLQQNSLSLSKTLTLVGDEARNNLHALIQALTRVHEDNQKNYHQNLQQSLALNTTIMEDIQAKSKEFYQDMNVNLESFVQHFSNASSQINVNCANITKDLQVLQENNQATNQNLLKNTQEFSQRFYNHLETTFADFYNNLNINFGQVLQKNTDLLGNMEQKIIHFDSILINFEKNSKGNFEALNNNFKNLCVQYVKLMQASMQANIKNQNIAAQEINKAILSIKENVHVLTDSSNKLFNTQEQAFNVVVQHFKTNTEMLVAESAKLHNSLGANLENLDTKMEKMTQSFANNYEWFLKRVRELMGA